MSTLSYTCWLCGGVNLLAHPSLHQIAPCPTCIEKLRAVVAPSPASAVLPPHPLDQAFKRHESPGPAPAFPASLDATRDRMWAEAGIPGMDEAPASAAPEREKLREIAFAAAGELRTLARRHATTIEPEEEDAIEDEMVAALSAVSPHFAPRPKVRLPEFRHTTESSSDCGWDEALTEVRAALRSAGIEIERASDEA